MQCAGDGYFILPVTIGDYLADEINTPRIPVETPEFEQAEKAVREKIHRLMAVNGNQTVTSFHRRLGRIMWDMCGMVRNEEGLKKAIEMIDQLKEEFWKDVRVPGLTDELNQELEKAIKVSDFFEIGRLMCEDALERKESCGAHFREESQTPDGEALRNDSEYSYVAAWEYKVEKKSHALYREKLKFENVTIQERSYK